LLGRAPPCPSPGAVNSAGPSSLPQHATTALPRTAPRGPRHDPSLPPANRRVAWGMPPRATAAPPHSRKPLPALTLAAAMACLTPARVVPSSGQEVTSPAAGNPAGTRAPPPPASPTAGRFFPNKPPQAPYK
jgi:hypothetical protein